MKVLIEIPKEFEEHFNKDRFKDSFERILVDIQCGLDDVHYDVKQAYQQGAEFGYNKAMNEAKGIIKDLLHCLPEENIEGVYEVAEEAEQFLSEVEK